MGASTFHAIEETESLVVKVELRRRDDKMKEDELWITCCNSFIESFLPFAIADGHKSKAFFLGLCLAGFQSVFN